MIGTGDDRSTVALTVTKRRVRRMRLRIRHRHSHIPANWVSARTHRLSARKAREAHVKRDFRFAVILARGRLCVTKVVLFDRSGARIKSFGRACRLP